MRNLRYTIFYMKTNALQGFHFYISASLITRVHVQQHYNMFKSVTISLVSYTFCKYHMFQNISDDPLITANHLERVINVEFNLEPFIIVKGTQKQL